MRIFNILTNHLLIHTNKNNGLQLNNATDWHFFNNFIFNEILRAFDGRCGEDISSKP